MDVIELFSNHSLLLQLFSSSYETLQMFYVPIRKKTVKQI